MKFKKVVAILVCVFFVRLFSACIPSCPETFHYAYRYTSLQANGLNNSGNEPVLADDSVPKKAFAIRLEFLLERISFNTHSEPTLFSAAYADDCPPASEITSNDVIESFTIFTLTKFDAAHEIDSDVSEYFRLKPSNDSYDPISKFVTYPDLSTRYNFPENKKELDVFLLAPPQSTGVYSFRIELRLSDGRVLSAVTNPILLN